MLTATGTAVTTSDPGRWLPFVFMFMGVLGPIFFLLVVFLIVRAVRSGGSTPITLDPNGPVQLQGHLTPGGTGVLSGQFDRATYGTVALDASTFYWQPDQGEQWSTPIAAITVLRTTGNFSMTDPHVDMAIAGSGEWRLVVSDKRINRFMTSDAKRFREAKRAKEFAERLLLSGARRQVVASE